ncbi:MAG TPA: Rne/Rng family ribonuclease [Bryobacteraceae bacterium]|nr:Rne/Rng family ribonuclease [Bryobacteraceae bacterium]
MSKELVVSSNRHETRVAILEDDQLVEIYFQRQQEYSLAGSIHKGRVTRVLPGMQSAFVDIGLDRDAFLYVSDFFEDNDEYDQVVSSVEERVLRLEKTPPPPVAAPPIDLETATKIDPVRAAEQSAPLPVAHAPVDLRPAGQSLSGPPDRDGRDRRGGRRPRRRRGKGRGFPESKYASPAGPGEIRRDSPGAATVEEPKEEAGAEVEDLPVLPGETISKYSQADQEPAEAADNWERDEAEPEPAVGPASDSAAGGHPAEQPVLTEEAAHRPEPEPAAAPPEAVAEAPVESSVSNGGQTEPEPVSARAAEPEEKAPEDVTEEGIGDTIEAAEAEETDFAAETLETEGPEDESADDPASVDAAAEDAAGGSIHEGVEPARIPTSLTAQLREQGGRYPHRVSRRMRRKMRGPGDGRPESGHESRLEPRPEPRPETREVKVEAPPRTERAERPPQASISDLLKEGQEIIVQIAKEPLGQKGARITSYVALPGRFVVYMPTVDHVGVSRKIGSDEERMRLKRILQSNRAGIPGGFILRTAGEGKTEEELRADMHFLYNLWMDIRQKAEKKKAPALIHHDLDLVQRILRDQLTSSFKNVWVDNEEMYEDVLSFVQRFQPAMVSRVKMYTRPTPIFDAFNITSELEKALRPKVWLKTGGYIVINQTEALVAIDINTGKYVGKSNRLEDTIVKTNTDAVKEIVRQIRLRDLGGIIVVDFIDMDERKNRQKVMQALEEAMRADKAPNKILSFNDFGLVAITRKRVKQSLERTLCSPCPCCEGAGYVKSVATVVGEILQEAHKIARAVEGADVVLRVNPEVAKVLKSHRNDYLQELEQILGRTVIVKSDPLLMQEKFDLA